MGDKCRSVSAKFCLEGRATLSSGAASITKDSDTMEVEADTWRLDKPKIQRGWSDSSTWDWAESGGGWDAEVTPIPKRRKMHVVTVAVATKLIFSLVW